MRDQMKYIVSSKNRACQLELCLRSLNAPATVIYTYDESFRAGYEKLIQMYPDVTFIKETNYKKHVLDELDGEDYVLFIVDDDIILKPLQFQDKFDEFRANEDIICLSLRLCPSYRPEIMTDYKWVWKNRKHSWGYPMSVSSHVFRVADILPVLETSEFTFPNEKEVALRSRPPKRPIMLCVEEPYMISCIANQVQTKYKWKHMDIPVEFLEKQFLNGYLIDLSDIRRKAQRYIANGASKPFLKEHYAFRHHSVL